uniref:Guanine nucleotide-binding protein G(Q) subunit alpha n=1 Tax=Phallusia mammillata TaxID=59560 RepID=A0A6F9DD82_9ASCI|nr:guanine nucleotide-binding protein G(q) subunit alpha [Phallusia mammillata]
MSNLASCFTGSQSSDAKSVSKEIERQLREAKKEARSQVKLLVLGAAESGKSTFIKQMRIIHGKGYTEEDRKSYITLVHQNVNMTIRTMANAMVNLGIKYEHETSKATADKFSAFTRDDETLVMENQVTELLSFWEDSGVQKCYLRGNEYHLLDSASYYMSHLQRITAINYLPTLQDILRARLPTSGITEYLFDIDSFIFGIVDVGGQKTERRKWIHCFENVTSIVFLAALSEYDQTIPEDEISQDLRYTLGSVRHQQTNKPMVRTNSEHLHIKSGSSSPSQGGKFGRKHHHSLHNQRQPPQSIWKHQGSLPPFPSTKGTEKNPNRGKTNSDSVTAQINRLRESCALFKTIVNSQWFRNTSVILFLNKTDVLNEKIHRSHVCTHFPEFTGPQKDSVAAREFILSKYSKAFDSMKHTKRTMYAHYTCATDTNNIRFVFAAIKDIIVQSYLINYNLV